MTKDEYKQLYEQVCEQYDVLAKEFEAIKQALAAHVQDVDWKDMYEKEKRRSEMWVAKYEKDIGLLEYAVPVAAPVQEPHKGLSEHLAQATNGRVRIDPVTGNAGIGTPPAQPAPVQEPVGYITQARCFVHLHECTEAEAKLYGWKALYTTPPAAQPAPVPWSQALESVWAEPDEATTPSQPATEESSATQPAQRPFVGLTDEEILKLAYPIRWQEVDDFAADKAVNFAQMVEAKLKEKNGWYRQHVTDGSPCWCEPETSYTDPKTGSSVIVHKEPQ